MGEQLLCCHFVECWQFCPAAFFCCLFTGVSVVFQYFVVYWGCSNTWPLYIIFQALFALLLSYSLHVGASGSKCQKSIGKSCFHRCFCHIKGHNSGCQKKSWYFWSPSVFFFLHVLYTEETFSSGSVMGTCLGCAVVKAVAPWHCLLWYVKCFWCLPWEKEECWGVFLEKRVVTFHNWTPHSGVQLCHVVPVGATLLELLTPRWKLLYLQNHVRLCSSVYSSIGFHCSRSLYSYSILQVMCSAIKGTGSGM